MSIGVFDKYADAQRAVDTLSDKDFPVQNCLIVGTELRQLERVTGRLTWSRVLLGGALSGIWLGLFVGLIFALFDAGNNPLQLVASTVLFGAVFGLVWAAIGYAMTRGQRDFTSVSRIVPGRFEILVEHKVAQQAREILAAAGHRVDGADAASALRSSVVRRSERAVSRAHDRREVRRRCYPGGLTAPVDLSRADLPPLDPGDPGFHVGRRARHTCGEVLVSGLGDQDVVLDAHP